MILTPLQKLTKNREDWGKLIVAKDFKKLRKVQNIAQSGHTVCGLGLLTHLVDYDDYATLYGPSLLSF